MSLRAGSAAVGLVGLGIAGYLTVVHYTGAAPVCGLSHGCETVQKSRYSELAGVPVALLGLIGYAGILASLWIPGETGLIAGAAQALVGFGFSAYLTTREIWSIHAICIWCIGSAIVLTLLAIVTTIRLVSAPPGSHIAAT
jgi:uncharacterized membrane protein